MVDWARAAGFKVIAAGKGTKFLPAYHQVTPAEVWSHYGLTADEAKRAGMNPQMFNSFLDGTKSALEMAAVANACDLDVPEDGLSFPPCGVDDLPQVLRPHDAGGQLAREGMVEVVSSLERDGRPVFRDLRWGVYVVFKAPSDYAASCFKQYGLATDPSGRYSAMYKPFHLIGLELSISVLHAVLYRQPTGATRSWRGDVAAVAKRDLRAGEMLDGEGGFTVYGRLIPVARSIKEGALPIGLAHDVALKRDIPAGAIVTKADVALRESLSPCVCAAKWRPYTGKTLWGTITRTALGLERPFGSLLLGAGADILLASLRRRKDRLHRTVVDLDQGQEISASNRIVRSEASCAALSADAQQSRSTVTL